MRVSINIKCEDEKDIYVHLSVIRQQIKQVFKEGIDDFIGFKEIEDENNYGNHQVLIEK